MPSSVIRNINYDKVSHTLKIIFVSGMEYHYQKVPLRFYQMLRTARSKGRYFNRFIRNRFGFEKIANE
ncbi:MAG: KTSC domain-containing protein [Bacteroidota bacterium]